MRGGQREKNMLVDLLLVISLLLATLSLLPGAAHLLELPNKINLSGGEYLTAQRLYRGWALTDIAVAAALLSTLALLFVLRAWPTAFTLAWVAFVCIAGTLIVSWTFTRPVNRMTADWTFLPGDWLELRRRWEYSHAAIAILDLVALGALLGCLFWTGDMRRLESEAARAEPARAAEAPMQFQRGHEKAAEAPRAALRDRYI
jgi:hypothetical protein